MKLGEYMKRARSLAAEILAMIDRRTRRLPRGGSVTTTSLPSSIPGYTPGTTQSPDERVAVDSAATADYLGAASNDGVLRTTSPVTYSDGGDYVTLGMDETAIDHGNLTGLGDDDHTQYAILAGRSGGQELFGGTGAGDDLLLRSTSHATKGGIGIGHATGGVLVNILATGEVVFADAPFTVHHRLRVGAGETSYINESGIDLDTIIKGDTDASLVHVDAGLDKVGIGVGAPNEKLEVAGNFRLSGAIIDTYNNVADIVAAVAPAIDQITITFGAALPDTNYSIELTGNYALCEDGALPTPNQYHIYGVAGYGTKLAGSFIIYPTWHVYDAANAWVGSWNNYNAMVAALVLMVIPSSILRFDWQVRRYL